MDAKFQLPSPGTSLLSAERFGESIWACDTADSNISKKSMIWNVISLTEIRPPAP